MQNLKLSNKSSWCLVGLWFLLCTGLITWFGAGNKSEFDPQMQLSQEIMDIDFEAKFVSMLQNEVNAVLVTSDAQDEHLHTGSVFHFTQGQCYCEWLAQPHQQSINAWAQDNQFNTHTLNITQHRSIKAIIPSTPAIAVVDAQGKLIYLGPYSRGTGCFARSGEVDEQLDKWLQMQTQSDSNNLAIITNTVIDTDASGCYCATEV